jgi:predicted DNA-binding transcriptional regulator AlpA
MSDVFEPIEPLMSFAETAKALNMSQSNLAKLRALGKAPPAVQISARRIAFKPSAVRAWIDARDEALPAKKVRAEPKTDVAPDAAVKPGFIALIETVVGA